MNVQKKIKNSGEEPVKKLRFTNTHVRLQTAEGVKRSEKRKLIAGRKKALAKTAE